MNSILLLPLLFLSTIFAQNDDASLMQTLKTNLNPPLSLGWSDPDPCKWNHVTCSDDNRVTRIQIGRQNLHGAFPQTLLNLTELQHLELQFNNFTGPLPSLTSLNSLQVFIASNNGFTSFSGEFFAGKEQLVSFEIDDNPFEPWELPKSLINASSLQNFSANNANVKGELPDFFGGDAFPVLTLLHLAFNKLEGVLPKSFSGSKVESLWLNGQKSDVKLHGSVDVLQNMTSLTEVWLHSNGFNGSLPEFDELKSLKVLSLRDNSFTGVVPSSLVSLKSLKVVNLTNNLFQGPLPVFGDGVEVDNSKDSNSFCLSSFGDCDPRVNVLLNIVGAMAYPSRFAESWKGNDPCVNWIGITCTDGNVSVVNFQKMGLTGTISPEFAKLKSLQRLILSDNNLTGLIPDELTTLPMLTQLNVANNQIYGKVPSFRSNVIVSTSGNVDIGKDKSSQTSQGSVSSNGTDASGGHGGSSVTGSKKSSSHVGVIVFSVVGAVFMASLIGFLIFCLLRMKQKKLSRVQSPNALVIHPRHSGSDNESVKITVAGSSVSVGGVSEVRTVAGSEVGDVQMVEAGNMVISIQVLRSVTNNFSEKNILGQGGFGTVYKGELHDGTRIAVKRMECAGAITGKGATEFKSEIAVLTKVRHRHLVALLGYCLDGNEKLLVYEYMPQGTLSRYLFNWPDEGLEPLGWNKRLTIALDVARGVEYLHSLAHQSFIHRDLKPSNILLGDDMRAKVADFGLVRLAPEGKASIETRIAGTFGYLAPEYAGIYLLVLDLSFASLVLYVL